MRSILFVCKGNVFRSMTAEKCFRKLVGQGARVGSAGTYARKTQRIHPVVLDELRALGVPAAKHVPRRVSRALIARYDHIIAMSTDHQQYLWNVYKLWCPLFHEICEHRSRAMLDLPDLMNPTPERVEHFLRKQVRHIHSCIPRIASHFSLQQHLKAKGKVKLR